jgi:hypothetical protein
MRPIVMLVVTPVLFIARMFILLGRKCPLAPARPVEAPCVAEPYAARAERLHEREASRDATRRAAVEADGPVAIAEGETLRAHYHSRTPWKIAALTTVTVGVAAGLALMLTTPQYPCTDPADCSDRTPYGKPRYMAGVVTGALATVISLALCVPNDWVSLDVVSAAPAPLISSHHEGTSFAAGALPSPETLQLRWRF